MPDSADVSPAAGVLVRLAGQVAIEGDGAEPRYLSSAQVQVAFARMVLERTGGTGREQLADTVWPDGLPETWASALRSVVSRVRSFVAGSPRGDDGHERGDQAPVVARGGRYLLRLPFTAVVDLERAEQEVIGAVSAHTGGRPSEALRLAESAVTCLRRPLLPNHDSDWVAEVRARLAELLVTGLEIASFAASALGDGPAALRFADEALRQAPLRESAHRARMTAHVSAGNRAEAVRTYHELRCALAEQLGIDPSPETQSAYVDLLGGPTTEISELYSAFRPGPRTSAPFVGRKRELAAIMQAYSRAERGTSHMVLITGEAGIGRTRLMAEAARQVSLAGGLVAGGRFHRGSVEPCRPLEQAVEALLAAGGDGLRACLGEQARQVLTAAKDQQAGAQRAERARAVADLLVGISADLPVLLFVDDLDLASEDVLAAIRQLFHRRHDTSLLVVATARRSPQCSEPLVALLREIDQNGWLYRISMLGLAEQDVNDLITEVVPAPFVSEVPPASRLLADTAGNAYLLMEMLWWPCERTVVGSQEELSPGIREYAAAQLAGLATVSRRLLGAAVAAGRSFELDLAIEAAEVDPEPALDAVDQLLAAGTVVEDGDGKYRLTHDVIRRAIYSGFSPARRRDLHSRLADVIESRRADDLVRYTTALARHRAVSAERGGDRRAVRWLWRAAEQAGAAGAADEAVQLHWEATRHVPSTEGAMRAEALTNLGLAQLAAGHPGSAQTLLDGALHAIHTGHLRTAAQAALGLADVVRARPELRAEAAALIEMLVQEVRGHSSRTERVDDVTLARMMARQVWLGSTVAAGSVTDAALVALTRELSSLAHDLGSLERRSILAGELLAVATAVNDVDAGIVGAHHQAMVAALRGDVAARRGALATMVAAAHRASPLGDALVLDHAVAQAVTEGRYTDAALTACLATTALGTRQGESAGGPVDGWTAVGPTPGSLAERQLVVAGMLQSRAWQEIARSPRTGVEAAEHALLALPAGARGRPHLTVRAFATGVEPLPPGDEWPHAIGVLALGAVEVGDPVTAEALRTMLTPHANLMCGVGYRTFVGPASFHLGRLAVVVGDWDEAENQLTSALSSLGEYGARPWVALAKQSLAWALSGRAGMGDRASARALLAEANTALSDAGLRHRVTASTRR